MGRALPILVALAVAAMLVVGLVQASDRGDDGPTQGSAAEPQRVVSKYDAAAAERAYAGVPPALRRLYDERSRLIEADEAAFEARLDELRGTPVVVNKWASWCGPCRAEFPHFQTQTVAFAGQVAFLGIDSGDNRADASAFLKRFPVPYPSFVDKGERLSRRMRAPKAYPATTFVDAKGRIVFTHFGYYRSEADLARDIRRYALGRR